MAIDELTFGIEGWWTLANSSGVFIRLNRTIALAASAGPATILDLGDALI